MPTPLFTGCAAALVTPFCKDGTLDEPALIHLIHRQRDAGMDALVLLGTTGEPSTLNMHERERIISLGLLHAGAHMPVIVGTGANDTRRAIEYARQAKTLGAAGQLCVTPYYNKATQDGLIRHYSSILDACALPMILYNVPSRTGMSITPDTLFALSTHPAIIGLKEASGNLSLSAEMLEATGHQLPLYAGNDDIILPLMAQGAVGAISVIANLLPEQTRAITHACLSGCYDEARSAQAALQPLIRALFTQVNPIPIKAALAAAGLIRENLRLPLTPLEEPHRKQLLSLMQQMSLLQAAE